MKLKNIITAVIVVSGLSMAYFILYRKPKLLSNELKAATVAKQCIGVIEMIDDKQRIIYYVINGEKFSFGNVGRFEIYYYASVGDSLIKRANSRTIKIVKPDKSKKQFEIN